MKLYHFTSLGHLVKILKDKELKLTSSNLKEPPDLSKELKLTKVCLRNTMPLKNTNLLFGLPLHHPLIARLIAGYILSRKQRLR